MSAPPSERKARPRYGRLAFWNPYNLSLALAAAAITAATGDWVVGAAAAGAEALWMLFAPDSKLLQRLWFDRAHRRALALADDQWLDETIAALPQKLAERARALRAKKAQIEKLAAENPALTAELLQGELGKLDRLLTGFVELCANTNRAAEYFTSVDWDALDTEVRKYSSLVDHGAKDDPQRALWLKNLELLQKRRAGLTELRDYVARGRAQLDVVDNTFSLLAEQVLTMRAPSELGAQLDELLGGVEAIRETARETEGLLAGAASQPLGIGR